MTTADFIEALRNDLSAELEKNILDKIMPLIEQKLLNNNFDVQEAATYLKVSAATVRRAAVSRDIPFYQLRGQYFFRQRDLDRWIDEQVVANYKPFQGDKRATAQKKR